MTANQAVARVVKELTAAGIPYMVVGSYSSNAYGIVRSTQDADFVIELAAKDINAVLKKLSPEIVFDAQKLLESVTATFRYIGKVRESGFKIELFQVNEKDPFDCERFARRRPVGFLDGEAVLPSAEDVIIQKLRWLLRANRRKDRDDVLWVIAVKLRQLDFDYIHRWTDIHGTRQLFEEIKAEAESKGG